MNSTLPQRMQIYQNHHLDSTRWDNFKVRDNDILVCTSLKSGTTWMQHIVALLIFQDHQPEQSFHDISKWLDMRVEPIDKAMATIEAQQHRRFLKTHLSLDGLPYFPEMKYIVIGRDLRDVFMSLWNHLQNMGDNMINVLNTTPGLVGDPLTSDYEDIHAFWQTWINKGSFDWEADGYPFWSHLHFVHTWWEYRHLSNIYLVHFNDLLEDLEGEMRKIAAYLDIEVEESLWPGLVERATFESMKTNASELLPGVDAMFAGGAKSFINKGTNGRWRDVLSSDELKQCDAAIARELSSDCALWLEQGGAENL